MTASRKGRHRPHPSASRVPGRPCSPGFRAAALFALAVMAVLGPVDPSPAPGRDHQIEKQVLMRIRTDAFAATPADRRCRDDRRYRIYLIDNFEQTIGLVPEVKTSHGEMLMKVLLSGRSDFDVRAFNTSLSRGLALVIQDLASGGCADAVVSSIPGSNYTYEQLGSLFIPPVRMDPETILEHEGALRAMMRTVAFQGFPSVEWLQRADVNPTKLRNDARMFAFIEAIGQFGVPVILPYGNVDATHGGKVKSVNLLSLAPNALAFSALDADGRRIPGYPYSPLSAGDETGVYEILECPHPEDPFKAQLDINGDGDFEYTFFRTGAIAYRDGDGREGFAPAVMPQSAFSAWAQRLGSPPDCRIEDDVVLTAEQYRAVKRLCPGIGDAAGRGTFVWVMAAEPGRVLDLEPRCWSRGRIQGTSVIPPNKVKELLPPKKGYPDHLRP